MVLSVNNPVTGYTAFNKTVILPRTAKTVDDTPKNDTFEVEQALKRLVPLTPVSYVDELDLNAPLVSFLAEPTAQSGAIISKNIGWGALLGGITGLFLAGSASRNHGLAFLAPLGLFSGLGWLFGLSQAGEVAKNQQWVNNNMIEMIDLTSPNTLLKKANKVLQQDTGESFTQRLANRQNRQQMQVTQEMVAANIGVSASR
jgi:hypothetical protein